MVEARQDYEAGVELIVQGDDIAGEAILAAASTRMLVAGRECANTPGCDASLIAASTEEVAAKLAATLDVAEESTPAEADLEAELAEIEEPVPPAEIEAPSLLRGSSHQEGIPRNPRVQAQLNAWLTWKRPALIGGFESYRYLRPHVAHIYHEVDLPEATREPGRWGRYSSCRPRRGATDCTRSTDSIRASIRCGPRGPARDISRTICAISGATSS
jgi:hypothetical protein